MPHPSVNFYYLLIKAIYWVHVNKGKNHFDLPIAQKVKCTLKIAFIQRFKFFNKLKNPLFILFWIKPEKDKPGLILEMRKLKHGDSLSKYQIHRETGQTFCEKTSLGIFVQFPL